MPGKLKHIWIKRAKLGPMDPVGRAVLEEGSGILGNANRGGKRQVTVIETEAWEKMMRELNADTDPSARRANLMIEGIPLLESSGKRLRVGSCEIELLGETRPCERMDEALPGLRNAMKENWRGGAFGIVLKGGEIRVGDDVELI